MNNRLTIQDLAALLAEHTGKDKSLLERFLKEFIAVISEGVYVDKIVKVKGLGTFKIIPVEQRESIHVNTGERFLIPAHYKFSFLPDKELRELVNKPFSFFETIEISENADFPDIDMSEESQEDKELEDESVEEVVPEEKPLPELVPDSETAEMPKPEQEIRPDAVKEPQPELDVIQSSQAENQPKMEEVSNPRLVPVLEDDPEIFMMENRMKNQSKSRVSLTLILLVIFFFLAAYFTVGDIFKLYLEPHDKSVKPILELDTAEVDEADEALLEQAPMTKEQEDSMLKVAVKEIREEWQQRRDSAALVKAASDTVPQKTTSSESGSKVIARIKIEAGSRLTMIALDQYGSKVFWVYLYEYNKAKIKNPNNVPIGTIIDVPTPELYGINSRDRASVEKAAALQTEILTGKQE